MKELIGEYIITFPVGPIVSNSDGLTPVMDLTLSGADEKAIRKHGNVTPVSISANSWGAIESMDGHYNLTLTNSQMDTYGPMRVSIQDDSKCLPYFEDVGIVTSGFWNSKYNTNDWALASALPNSQTLNAHIVTLPTSEVLNAHIVTLPLSGSLPSSGTLKDLINTLPNSQVLNAHMITLPTSLTLKAHVDTLPTSETLNTHDAALATLIGTLPTSLTLQAHMVTLPTSETLKAQISTLPASGSLPSSSALADLIGTLPSSLTLQAHIVTLPTSQTLNAHAITLPTSQTVMNAISSMDVRVSSLFYTEIESGYPFLEKQRIDMAVLAGITSGGGSATLHFRDVGDTKSRLIVTVDSDGNRTAVNTLDGS